MISNSQDYLKQNKSKKIFNKHHIYGKQWDTVAQKSAKGKMPQLLTLF